MLSPAAILAITVRGTLSTLTLSPLALTFAAFPNSATLGLRQEYILLVALAANGIRPRTSCTPIGTFFTVPSVTFEALP